MSIRILVAAIAVVAVPIAVSGEEPPGPLKDNATKKICEVNVAIGSRLRQVRRCLTAREWEEYRRNLGVELNRQLALRTVNGGN